MSGGTEITDSLLEKAFRAIIAGRLPRSPNPRVGGGRGTGKPCTLCEQPIGPAETEMELDIPDGLSGGRFHLHCHSVWLEACERLASTDLPPAEGASTRTQLE